MPALHHPHFHTALRSTVQIDFVHEIADEENPAAAALQQVLWRERVGNRVGIESLPLVAHANDHFRHAVQGGRELHENALGHVVLVPVLDGVDDTFPDGDADPVDRIFVEADVAADMAADDFDEIDHVKCAGKLEPDAQGMLRNHWMRMEYHPICEMMSS